MVETRSVAVLDSGLGGTSVLRQLMTMASARQIIYVADTQCFPYGSRHPDELRQRLVTVVDKVMDSHAVSDVLIACNTAAVSCLSFLEHKFQNVRFFGIRPPIKWAADRSLTRRIAVLSTPVTTQVLQTSVEVIRLRRQGVHVDLLASPTLAAAVEALLTGQRNQHELGLDQELASLKKRLVASGVDMLILGCTHYPLLMERIREVTADLEITVVDPSAHFIRGVCRSWMHSGTTVSAGAKSINRVTAYVSSQESAPLYAIPFARMGVGDIRVLR